MEHQEKLIQIPPIEEIHKFNELMDSSYELAKKLLPFLAKKRIPLIPENYRLFYDYFLAVNPELNRQINDALQHENLFTHNVSQRLYKAFYDVDQAKANVLAEMGEQIGNIGHSLEINLGQSLDSAGRFKQALFDSAAQMEDGTLAVDDMRDMVDSLLVETKSAMDSQTALAELIETSNRVIASLTAELKDQTRLANVDQLTQLFNRRYLTQSFQELTANLKVDDHLGISLFDIDHFKNVNDTYGHAVGDKVLMICAKIIKSLSGGEHMACRYGGEEFVLLSPGYDSNKTAALAEAIRQKINDTQITIRGINIPLTLSAGVSSYIHGESEEDFVSKADLALYKAKNSGRNRVVVYQPEMSKEQE
ncbi:MAG: GGDEF domain-containing protein [Deltaproteobacteria bacterium]|nr:GGDEF domain-containing protein [Deltaproteobacteria bacterium]